MSTDKHFSRNKIWEILGSRNVTKVTIAFSGGNDEGYAENPVFHMADGSTQELVISSWPQGHWRYGENGCVYTEDQLLYMSLEKPINDRYGTFAGEYEVSGELVWDVTLKKAVLDTNESETTWNNIVTEV